jgi:hypothetical protein
VAQILNFDFKKDCGPQAPSPAFFKVGEISRLSSMSVAKTHQLKAKSQWPRAKSWFSSNWQFWQYWQFGNCFSLICLTMTAMSAITRDVGDPPDTLRARIWRQIYKLKSSVFPRA